MASRLKVLLDELDWRILSQLQADASLSNLALAQRVHASAPTCLRRVLRLKTLGVIQREVAVLDQTQLGVLLTAIIEITLDRQTAEALDECETRLCSEPAVTQCYRVSPGPDFMVIAELADMPAYDAFARRLFTGHANIRNIRAFFSTRRAKFETGAPLQPLQPVQRLPG